METPMVGASRGVGFSLHRTLPHMARPPGRTHADEGLMLLAGRLIDSTALTRGGMTMAASAVADDRVVGGLSIIGPIGDE
jgi:hypothetical protein